MMTPNMMISTTQSEQNCMHPWNEQRQTQPQAAEWMQWNS